MNLIKTTALLVTLSVFAMTSCGPKGASFKDSVKWIKEHYDENEPKRSSDESDYEWDFTKTTDKDSQDFALELLSFVVGEKDITLKGSRKTMFRETHKVVAMTPEMFEEDIGPIKDQCRFSFTDSELTLVSEQDYPISEESKIFMKVTLVTKLDNKCIPYCLDIQFNNSATKIEGKTYTLNGYIKGTYIFKENE